MTQHTMVISSSTKFPEQRHLSTRLCLVFCIIFFSFRGHIVKDPSSSCLSVCVGVCVCVCLPLVCLRPEMHIRWVDITSNRTTVDSNIFAVASYIMTRNIVDSNCRESTFHCPPLPFVGYSSYCPTTTTPKCETSIHLQKRQKRKVSYIEMK